jgi:transmembrane sensor
MVRRTIDKNDISPEGNRAILTLADGSSIVLDAAQNGYVTNQGNTKIIKLNTGLLSYKDGEKDVVKIMYNTITTPRGGQYQLKLADGTDVWLNSASSLTFPAAFPGKEKSLELKGEGYFDVAKNASKPFHVKVNNIGIKVLGTHFNIMGYSDYENINTTLLQGKVNVISNEVTKNLLPGKQAVLNKATNHFEISKANITQAVAWKNGESCFKDTGIKELVRQVGRRYDVNVEYRTAATCQVFTASLPRIQNVSSTTGECLVGQVI